MKFFQWFTKKKQTRSLENPAVPMAMPWYGPPTLSGLYINEHTALTYSAFWAAVRLISVDCASLKIQPMQHNDKGGCSPAKEHWSYPLVVHSPDEHRPSIRFWASMFQHGLCWGNAYAEIIRPTNKSLGWQGVAFKLLPPWQVTPKIGSQGQLYYDVQGDEPRRILPFNMIHLANPMSVGTPLDGIIGQSVVQIARESIGLGLSTETALQSWAGNATRPGGNYDIPPGLDDQAQINLREAIDQMHAGPLNTGRPGMFPPGVKFNPTQLPSPDEEYLNSRIFQIQEVARWFSIPPTKLGDYSNGQVAVEQLEKAYYKSAVKPWVDFLIAELNLKLLTTSEQDDFFFKANYNELHVTDIAVKTAYFQAGRLGGWFSVNDIRHDEGLDGIGPAGDIYLSPANMVTDKQLLALQDAPIPEPTQAPAPSLQAPTQANDSTAIKAVRSVVLDAASRLMRREASAMRRAAKKPGFRDSVQEFFADHQSLLHENLQSPINAYAAVANKNVDLPSLTASWIEESISSLYELESVCTSDQLPTAVDDLLTNWESERPLKLVEGL